MKKLLVMCVVLLLTGAAKGDYLYPSNHEEGVSIDLQLDWEAEAERGLVYYWFLDDDYTAVLRATRRIETVEHWGYTAGATCANVDGLLDYDTGYCWKVDTYGGVGGFRPGPIWYFTTETVPEPATLTLLGLGVMMIRRRGR